METYGFLFWRISWRIKALKHQLRKEKRNTHPATLLNFILRSWAGSPPRILDPESCTVSVRMYKICKLRVIFNIFRGSDLGRSMGLCCCRHTTEALITCTDWRRAAERTHRPTSLWLTNELDRSAVSDRTHRSFYIHFLQANNCKKELYASLNRNQKNAGDVFTA